MKNLLLKFAGASLLALGLSTAALATPINGVITFTGNAALDGPVSSATGVTSWSDTAVNLVSGTFVPYIAHNDFVTFAASWTFATPTDPFWSVGGFSFNLTSASISTQSLTTLSVDGSGWVSGNGFDPTYGTWYFSTQPGAINGMFSFSASSAVPDGGTTALLLGVSLVGMSFIARRRKQIQA